MAPGEMTMGSHWCCRRRRRRRVCICCTRHRPGRPGRCAPARRALCLLLLFTAGVVVALLLGAGGAGPGGPALTLETASAGNVSGVLELRNELSLCHFSAGSAGMLCATLALQGAAEVPPSVQYAGVRAVAMCDHHFCVLFEEDRRKLSCSGYVASVLGAPRAHEYLNPLSPLPMEVFFHAERRDMVALERGFGGYNLLLRSFEQDVVTFFDAAASPEGVAAVSCQPFGTCVTHAAGERGRRECFGAEHGLAFHGAWASLGLGLGPALSVALCLLGLARLLGMRRLPLLPLLPLLGCCAAPLAALVAAVLVFRVAGLVVLIDWFFAGALAGVALAAMLVACASEADLCAPAASRHRPLAVAAEDDESESEDEDDEAGLDALEGPFRGRELDAGGGRPASAPRPRQTTTLFGSINDAAAAWRRAPTDEFGLELA